jgi:hypothetical protein
VKGKVVSGVHVNPGDLEYLTVNQRPPAELGV